MQHRIHAGNGRRVGRRARSNRARPRCCVLAPTLPPISTPSRQRIDELLWPWPLAVARRADRRSRPDHSIGLIPPRNCIPAGSEGRRPLLRCRTAPKADQIARGGPSRVRPDAARFAQYPVRPEGPIPTPDIPGRVRQPTTWRGGRATPTRARASAPLTLPPGQADLPCSAARCCADRL
jgi:hypothetical protein